MSGLHPYSIADLGEVANQQWPDELAWDANRMTDVAWSQEGRVEPGGVKRGAHPGLACAVQQ